MGAKLGGLAYVASHGANSSSSQVDRGSLTEEALELLRLVPEGYIPLPHQVGGHRHVDGKLGMSHWERPT